jgi:hypothetical protein
MLPVTLYSKSLYKSYYIGIYCITHVPEAPHIMRLTFSSAVEAMRCTEGAVATT